MSGNVGTGSQRAISITIAPIVLRQLLPLACVGAAFWLLRAQLPSLDLSEIWQAMQKVSLRQWTLAGGATAASFWAIARYDQVMHGVLNTGIAPDKARISGASAIAIAQFTGFGVLSGALVRWRLLPDLSLPQALRFSFLTSMTFLAGWAVVTSGAVLLTDVSIYGARPIAIAVLCVALAATVFMVFRGQYISAGPGVAVVKTIVLLVLVDTMFAALALWAFLPIGTDVAPTAVAVALLISLGAGMLGGTPGGIGPFELCLIALLPTVPDATLVATALAFRVVYHLIPALLGLGVLLLGLTDQKTGGPRLVSAPGNSFLSPSLERCLWTAKRAEANLLRQGELDTISVNNQPIAIAAKAGQSLVMLGDAITPNSTATNLVHGLSSCAKQTQRSPLLYKCSAHTALTARRAGWKILPIAQEAWLRPEDFSTEGRASRQLRRYVRKAEIAGVSISEGGRNLPLSAMQQMSDDWAQRHGGEKRFSMGRFEPNYVCCQRVFLAYQGDQLVGFITLHESRFEWTLDLMRSIENACDGTMHLLVLRAIEAAAGAQCPRLSLAAVSHPGTGDGRLTAELRLHISAKGGDGLRRFKTSFSPHWETLYAAAPTRWALVHGLWSTLLQINRGCKRTPRRKKPGSAS